MAQNSYYGGLSSEAGYKSLLSKKRLGVPLTEQEINQALVPSLYAKSDYALQMANAGADRKLRKQGLKLQAEQLQMQQEQAAEAARAASIQGGLSLGLGAGMLSDTKLGGWMGKQAGSLYDSVMGVTTPAATPATSPTPTTGLLNNTSIGNTSTGIPSGGITTMGTQPATTPPAVGTGAGAAGAGGGTGAAYTGMGSAAYGSGQYTATGSYIGAGSPAYAGTGAAPASGITVGGETVAGGTSAGGGTAAGETGAVAGGESATAGNASSSMAGSAVAGAGFAYAWGSLMKMIFRDEGTAKATGAAGGAAIGAYYGSAYGPIGTIIGAVIGGIIGFLGGGGSVICTELHRQGFLSDELLLLDSIYGETYIDRETYWGYRKIADPIVRLMQKSRFFTKWIIRPIALCWCFEVAHRVAPDKYRGNIIGKLMLKFGVSICRRIGKNKEGVWAY